MVRAISLMAMAGGFLMISAKLRESVWGVFAILVGSLDQYSPFSYVGLALGLVLGFLFYLRAASAPR